MLRNFSEAVFMLFFPFFILLLMCCAVCEPAFAENTFGTLPNTLALFEPDKTQFDENDKVLSGRKTFKSFTFPSLSYVGNVLVVFAQAKKQEKFTNYGIVEGHIKFENIVNGTFSNTVAEKWKRSVVIQYQNTDSAESFTAVVNSKKFYVFFFKNLYEAEGGNWEYNLIDGEVNDGEANQIKWGNVVTKPKKQFIDSGINLGEYILTGSEGSGIFLQEFFLIPIEYENKTGPGYFSAIINSSINKGKNWNLVSSTPFAEGMRPAIVEWENKLIMMTSSKEGYRKVYEYNDTGKKWKEVVTSLSGVWGNTKERKPDKYGRQSGFITAQIVGNKKAILFTQTVAKDENNDSKYQLHLWVTDYKRIYDAGPISAEVDQNVFSTLLFAQGKLFAAYEKWHEGKSTIYVAYLQKQLEDVTNVLNKWTEQDNILSTSCFADDGTITSDDTCTDNRIPADGLVGFLSNNYSGNDWGDKYMCVNATVAIDENKVTQVDGGLKFSGPGAGATWPVGAQGQNQRYHFANYGFTLVAMVMIDSDTTENKNENSIFGFNFGKENNKKSIGLWCTKEGEWIVGEKGVLEKQENGEKCDKNKIYQVALTLNDKEVSVYIDGKTTKWLPENIIPKERPLSINHFYFGAESDKPLVASDVTITNVLLYNRPFAEEEIKQLKPKQINVANTTRKLNDSFEPNDNTTKAQSHKNTSATPTNKRKDGAKTKFYLISMSNVMLLSFLLFNGFTFLERYV